MASPESSDKDERVCPKCSTTWAAPVNLCPKCGAEGYLKRLQRTPLPELQHIEPVAWGITFNGIVCNFYRDETTARTALDNLNYAHPDGTRRLVPLHAGPVSTSGALPDRVWWFQDVVMHLEGVEAQGQNLSDAIQYFKNMEDQARRQEKERTALSARGALAEIESSRLAAIEAERKI